MLLRSLENVYHLGLNVLFFTLWSTVGERSYSICPQGKKKKKERKKEKKLFAILRKIIHELKILKS